MIGLRIKTGGRFWGIEGKKEGRQSARETKKNKDGQSRHKAIDKTDNNKEIEKDVKRKRKERWQGEKERMREGGKKKKKMD